MEHFCASEDMKLHASLKESLNFPALAVEGLLTISLAYLFYPEIKQIAEYFIN
jgi:hypothetical protein